jgi:hypothetical protein
MLSIRVPRKEDDDANFHAKASCSDVHYTAEPYIVRSDKLWLQVTFSFYDFGIPLTLSEFTIKPIVLTEDSAAFEKILNGSDGIKLYSRVDEEPTLKHFSITVEFQPGKRTTVKYMCGNPIAISCSISKFGNRYEPQTSWFHVISHGNQIEKYDMHRKDISIPIPRIIRKRKAFGHSDVEFVGCIPDMIVLNHSHDTEVVVEFAATICNIQSVLVFSEAVDLVKARELGKALKLVLSPQKVYPLEPYTYCAKVRLVLIGMLTYEFNINVVCV